MKKVALSWEVPFLPGRYPILWKRLHSERKPPCHLFHLFLQVALECGGSDCSSEVQNRKIIRIF